MWSTRGREAVLRPLPYYHRIFGRAPEVQSLSTSGHSSCADGPRSWREILSVGKGRRQPLDCKTFQLVMLATFPDGHPQCHIVRSDSASREQLHAGTRKSDRLCLPSLCPRHKEGPARCSKTFWPRSFFLLSFEREESTRVQCRSS